MIDMRVLKLLFASLLFLLCCPLFAEGDAIQIRGKIIYQETHKPVGNLRLRFSNRGEVISTPQNGEFVYEVDAKLKVVEISIPDTNYVIESPYDQKLIIVDDPNMVYTIIVKSRKSKARPGDFIDGFREISAILNRLDASDSLIVTMLEEKFSQLLNTNPNDLRDAVEKSRMREKNYETISNLLLGYILKVKDLKDAFLDVINTEVKSKKATDNLTNVISAYNQDYEQLFNNRLSYENAVLIYWQNEQLARTLHDVFDYIINDVHTSHILKLSQDVRPEINKIVVGQVKDKKEKQKILANIKEETNSMANDLVARQFPILENKVSTLLSRMME